VSGQIARWKTLPLLPTHAAGRSTSALRKMGRLSVQTPATTRYSGWRISSLRAWITPSIRVETRAGKPLLVVQVGISSAIVPCGGRYLKRVGTTNRDFTPEELARQFLTRSGQTWDSLLTPYDIERVHPELLTTFVQLARPRLPYIAPDQPQLILENLGLLREGRLTNAGLLLFGRRPQERFVQARVRSVSSAARQRLWIRMSSMARFGSS